MTKAALLFALCLLQARAQNQLTVVSAANYQPIVSPGSLAAVFGTGLASGTESAQLDSAGQLPTQLASTSVTFNGEAARLIFVSPTQINLVIPDNTQTGAAAVVAITSNSRSQGSADVRKISPALFASNGAGTGTGSILNAVTYGASPFQVDSSENGGDDTRTRLAVFGTGIRLATSSRVRAQVNTDAGVSLDLPVEFAGPAPGFFGLDQINLILPAEADGIGLAHLTVVAENVASNPVDFTITSLPANRIHLASLAVSKAVVTPVESVAAVIFLNAPAPSGGVLVQLQSGNAPLAQLPMFATVPAGKTSLEVPIQTSSPVASQDVQLTATANGFTRTATLRIRSSNGPTLNGISVSPDSVTGGATVTGTVTLTSLASAGGVSVSLQSDSEALQLPATVTIPGSSTSANFTATTSVVANVTTARIAASLDGVVKTASLTLSPYLTLMLTPETTLGGTDVAGRLTLSEPAPNGGITIQLQSSDLVSARPPSSLTIPAGQLFGTFTVQTSTVVTSRTVSITATYRSISQSRSLTLTSGLQSAISTLQISPSTVRGGTPATGTVTLTNPAGANGIRVSLSTDNVLVAGVDMLITVPAGQTSITFTIRTGAVATPRIVTITAATGGTSKTATLTVN